MCIAVSVVYFSHGWSCINTAEVLGGFMGAHEMETGIKFVSGLKFYKWSYTEH